MLLLLLLPLFLRWMALINIVWSSDLTSYDRLISSTKDVAILFLTNTMTSPDNPIMPILCQCMSRALSGAFWGNSSRLFRSLLRWDRRSDRPEADGESVGESVVPRASPWWSPCLPTSPLRRVRWGSWWVWGPVGVLAQFLVAWPSGAGKHEAFAECIESPTWTWLLHYSIELLYALAEKTRCWLSREKTPLTRVWEPAPRLRDLKVFNGLEVFSIAQAHLVGEPIVAGFLHGTASNEWKGPMLQLGAMVGLKSHTYTASCPCLLKETARSLEPFNITDPFVKQFLLLAVTCWHHGGNLSPT